MGVRIELRHLSGSLAGRCQQVTLDEGRALSLGRDAGCDVRLHPAIDDAASGLHARLLLLADGTVAVEDQRSTNGTFLDGRRCPPFERVALADGARLRLGVDGPELQLSMESDHDTSAGGRRSEAAARIASNAGDGQPRATVAGPTVTSRLNARAAALWIVALAAALAALAGWLQFGRLERERRPEPSHPPTPSWEVVRSRTDPRVARVTSRYRITAASRGAAWGGTAGGSGVLIRPTLVLTSSHLVRPWRETVVDCCADAAPADRLAASLESVSVQFPGQEPVPATLFAIAGGSDLALLQIPPRPTAPLPLARSRRPLRGGGEVAVLSQAAQPALAPQPLTATPAADDRPPPLASFFLIARVARVERDGQGRARRVALDRSAAMAGGGGAVVDRRGLLVGLTQARFAGAGAADLGGRWLQTGRYVAGTIEVIPVEQIAEFLSRAGLVEPGAANATSP